MSLGDNTQGAVKLESRISWLQQTVGQLGFGPTIFPGSCHPVICVLSEYITCVGVVLYSTETSLELRDIVNLLSHQASHWRSIGIGLGVPHYVLNTIQCDNAHYPDMCQRCLESVIYWCLKQGHAFTRQDITLIEEYVQNIHSSSKCNPCLECVLILNIYVSRKLLSFCCATGGICTVTCLFHYGNEGSNL